MQLNSRQLEKYQGGLEKLLTEMLLDTENGTVRSLIPASPFPSQLSALVIFIFQEWLLCHVCSLQTVLIGPHPVRILDT